MLRVLLRERSQESSIVGKVCGSIEAWALHQHWRTKSVEMDSSRFRSLVYFDSWRWDASSLSCFVSLLTAAKLARAVMRPRIIHCMHNQGLRFHLRLGYLLTRRVSKSPQSCFSITISNVSSLLAAWLALGKTARSTPPSLFLPLNSPFITTADSYAQTQT